MTLVLERYSTALDPDLERYPMVLDPDLEKWLAVVLDLGLER